MRKLCPNLNREDGLETVLEVPIPEEMFKSMGSNVALRWENMATWMKAQTWDKCSSSPIIAGRYNDLSFLLYILGSPLIPLPLPLQLMDNALQYHPPPVMRHSSIEASTAKYIVQQYIAATGGQSAMNSLVSMCAIGEVKISASDFHQGDESVNVRSIEEGGGFVLWQKINNTTTPTNPPPPPPPPHDFMWCLELLVSGCKLISGSNGKLSWRQSSNQQTTISRGPPRPLRRFLQGLDPRSTANLFLDSVCIGEKIINDEDCFILKLDTCKSALQAQSTRKYEIIHHTIWGYFSQRSGLLVKFEDSRLLTLLKTQDNDDDEEEKKEEDSSDDHGGVFWETSTESVIEDYKYVDGVNIAHSGTTFVTVYRYGEQSANHRRELEEAWKIEEVDFNVWGLSADFFMPPSDIIKPAAVKT